MPKAYCKFLLACLLMACLWVGLTIESVCAVALPVENMCCKANSSNEYYLQSQNWVPEVRESLNEMLRLYGSKSTFQATNGTAYAVFDFDNTTSIMDMEEQLAVWQLDRLAFAIKPEELQVVLQTGIPSANLSVTYGAEDGIGRQVSLQAAINDAVTDYNLLCSRGWVTVQGLPPTEEVQNNPTYLDFKAKMRWLYDAIGNTLDASTSYPWLTYWFTGMTPQEVYRLAYDCANYYATLPQGQEWTRRQYLSGALGEAGQVKVSYNVGITVTPEIKELYTALSANGVDIWINSASALDVIRAARDYFQLPGVTGIVAMTNKLDTNGRYTNVYNYNLHPQTQGEGKTATIQRVIAPLYNGAGPIFCAMDSQGDFNFATEFADTKAVLIINRTRKDDAALCAGIAAYQSLHGISLVMANQSGETKFLLQGRNENSGVFWPESATLHLGKTEKVLLQEKALQAEEELAQGATVAQMLAKNTILRNYHGYKYIR